MLTAPLVAVLSFAAILNQQPDPLRVLRAVPQGEVEPAVEILITFDRPVAAGLEETVSASAIFSIEPAVEGTVEWRDPVTIRFSPDGPFTPRTNYRVTIANTFRAMDGSRLAEPFIHSFRIEGPKVLAGAPVGRYSRPQFVRPNERFELLLSVPPDSTMRAQLSRFAELAFGGACAGPSRIGLDLIETQRLDPETASWNYRRYARSGPYGKTPQLLTVAVVGPRRPLPPDCEGNLRVPEDLQHERGAWHEWKFRTHGPFRLARVRCGYNRFCPTGPLRLQFSTPVRGADVLRHIAVYPRLEFTVRDTLAETNEWSLEAELEPRTSYVVSVDPSITDVFGQPFTGDRVFPISSTGMAPTVSYPGGRWLVERQGAHVFTVEHVNIDTLEAIIAPVPRSAEATFLARPYWGWEELWDSVAPRATRRAIPVHGEQDEGYRTGVRLPVPDARRPGAPTLLALKFSSPSTDTTRLQRGSRLALAQVTDLGVHAHIGAEESAVWVTGASDGEPRPGARVVLHDSDGRQLASGITDSTGLARLRDYTGEKSERYRRIDGYVAVTLGDDRALAAAGNTAELAPWRFGVSLARGDDRKPLAGAVFTERDIYRPGEPVYAKAIARRGPLGDLRPAAGDSLRWLFRDRDNEVIKDTTAVLSRFGTADHLLDLKTDIPLGRYRVEVSIRDDGEWTSLGTSSFRVAEYRPPEFLVDAQAEEGEFLAGDTFSVDIEARYLFGAPMGRAAVSWAARERPTYSAGITVPEGFYVGVWGPWWEDSGRDRSVRTVASAQDTLDDRGHLRITVASPQPRNGRPAVTTVEATVTDVNRQTVSAAASVMIHPANFYIAARPEGEDYFWRAGEPQRLSIITVRPDGEPISGVAVSGTVIRREWHRVRRERHGRVELVGEWVSDTVSACAVTTATDPVSCSFTPEKAGTHFITLSATDAKGRQARSGFYRWVVGEDWVPWYDESQFKMDLIPDRSTYSVGDTAEIFVASPFTDAEAWVTVEREGIIEQRRIRITAGATTLRFPITEAFVPNAFVSVLVTRGRSAPPEQPDDPGRPTIRVGYTQLSVTPRIKRLDVSVRPRQEEYRPGDTVRVELEVRDSDGHGREAEVTLWAVDKGVLALTGFRTPDPVSLIYRARGLGMRLASNLAAVAEQMRLELAEDIQMKGEPGGGGGMDVAGILRSRFQTTAFFLGSVVTDASGEAVAEARLPDNLTAFRVMAVAVTAGDRYGSGESELLVTRPLLARPALPRFLREGDRFSAGVVINHRLGGSPTVTVETEAEDAELQDEPRRQVTLEPGRGVETRFRFQAAGGADSATFRFKVSGVGEADAVQKRLAIRPSYHPRGYTVSGVLWDTASARFDLPPGIDPKRSSVELSVGGSPLAFLRGARRILRVYPYYCTEQVVSTALPLIALYRAGERTGSPLLEGDPAAEIDEAIASVIRRQRSDGGIGYWHSDDWTSPWVSAYAGEALLEARAAGFSVPDSVFIRLGDYLEESLRRRGFTQSPLVHWYRRDDSFYLSEGVAAVEYLRRIGRPNLAAENELFGRVAQMRWEDRVRLAGVVGRREPSLGRALLIRAWSDLTLEGKRASLPDTLLAYEFYIPSTVRPMAWLLKSTLAVDPTNPIVGPLLSTVVAQGRAASRRRWNTHDYGAAVLALLRYEELREGSGGAAATISARGRTIAEVRQQGEAPFETTRSLDGLLMESERGVDLNLALASERPDVPTYYFITVREVPRERPVRPGEAGIQVGRWYEDYETGEPAVSVAEGQLIRVRLRVTVPETRYFFVLDDPLPAGLEAIDLSLRTQGSLPQGGDSQGREPDRRDWFYGSWQYGRWSPFDHKELRDDRVIYFATVLWPGTYEASYVARATTPGQFVRPPAHAEEMYDPGINGRSDGGEFTVSLERR